MAADAVPTLLERKIAAARPRGDPLAMTPERAVAAALARAADKMVEMPLAVLRTAVVLQTAAEIVETLPDQSLLAMLDGPKEALGLAVLGSGTVAALIEMMTLGRLSPGAPPARRPTRTDAAMVAGFLDAALAELESLLAEEVDVTWAGGFRYASHLADARPLGLMLDERSYRVFSLTLGFGTPAGADGPPRRGEVTLVFPAKGRGAAPVPGAKAADAQARVALEQSRDASWDAALERAIMDTQTELRAVLGRIVLPLSDVLKLEAGISLPVPMAALQMVRVEAGGDVLLCLAHLGQGGGRRALRLYDPAETDAAGGAAAPVASELVPASAQPLHRAPPARLGSPVPAMVPGPATPAGGTQAALADAATDPQPPAARQAG